MEPLQTWWTTELYPTSDEDNFGVVGNFEVVKAADAQATIEALQARVRELESDPYKQGFADALEKVASDWASKEFRGHDEVQGVEVQAFLDTRHVHYEECRGVKPLQSQLTQRTAELERVRGERDEYAHKTKMLCLQNGPLMIENHDMKKLIAALPKVEGEINERFCTGSYYSSPRDYRTHVTFEAALVALLKHRQGMEGV